MTFATDILKDLKYTKVTLLILSIIKIYISGLSTIPDDMMPINEEMIVSADKRIAQHIRPTSGYRNVLLFWEYIVVPSTLA